MSAVISEKFRLNDTRENSEAYPFVQGGKMSFSLATCLLIIPKAKLLQSVICHDS